MAGESSAEVEGDADVALDEDTIRYIVRMLNSQRSSKHDLGFVLNKLEEELAALATEQRLYEEHEADLRRSSVQKIGVGLSLAEEEKLLEEVIAEDVGLDEELSRLQDQLEELNDVERSILAWQNDQEEKAHERREGADSLELRTCNMKKEYDVLKCVNVLNDCFYIWHDGEFGTINGLRMGRLTSNPIPWVEVNAAWGQCALLVSTLAKELRFAFKKYRLIPMGSYTKIAKLGEEVSSYELCTTGGFFNKRRFDTAVCWFMACVNDLGSHAEMVDRAMKLPYEMNGEKIGGVSLRLVQSTLADWTRACKYLLTNLKWLMIWSAKSRNQ